MCFQVTPSYLKRLAQKSKQFYLFSQCFRNSDFCVQIKLYDTVTFLIQVIHFVTCLEDSHSGLQGSISVSVASKWNLGTSIFNWNDLYDIKRNTEGLYSCLICYQIHWKVHNFSFLGAIFLGAHSIWTVSLLLWMRLCLFHTKIVKPLKK